MGMEQKFVLTFLLRPKIRKCKPATVGEDAPYLMVSNLTFSVMSSWR